MKEIDMRYDGAARWSQSSNQSMINRVWNFFSLVRVGIYIIVVILVLSILGTIFPQEHFITAPDPQGYYSERYGQVGNIFYTLGFTRMYASWWYKTLLGMLLISLIIASLDRFVPLYRALKHQPVRRKLSFLMRQQIHTQWPAEPREFVLQWHALKQEMQKKGYSVREEGPALLAEKARFSRWGPYINHTGLILIIVGTLLMTSIPGWYLDKYIWVQEGEITQVTGTPYYVKNEKFTMDFYSEDEMKKTKSENMPTVKRYQTDAVLYEKVGVKQDGEPDLKPVKKQSITVNDPLRYEMIRLYQADYKLDEWKAMTFFVSNKKTGDKLGDFTVDLYHPEPYYTLSNGVTVAIDEYFPALAFNEKQEPMNVSSKPENPAFIFTIKGPEAPKGERSWAIIGTPLDEIQRENVYKANFKALQTVNASGLKISLNKGMAMIWTGVVIFMLGIVVGMYWQHRRLWLLYEGGTIYLGAHTNKGWLGLRKEIVVMMNRSGLHMTEDQLQPGGK